MFIELPLCIDFSIDSKIVFVRLVCHSSFVEGNRVFF